MAGLDIDWAVGEIDAFLDITAQVVPDTGPGVVYLGTVMRGTPTDASAGAHVVEQILDRVLPGWKSDRPDKDKDFKFWQEYVEVLDGAYVMPDSVIGVD